uniref:Uncharacterized protein n=1 Tax=Anguilla anguilla TaxID=7936 RepID=A0A0E9Q854_ANGAN
MVQHEHVGPHENVLILCAFHLTI